MFKINIISTLRHLIKRPFFLFINVTGLTLGVLISSLLALYVNNELTVDKGLAKSNETYRLLRLSSRNGESYRIGVTSGPFAEALLNDYPQDIESTLRVYFTQALVSVDNETHFNETHYLLADSNFFDFFNYEFIYGNEATAFSHSQSIVLTEEIAKQYFGDQNPLNKTISMDQTYDFIVTGVIKKPEYKSQLDFNMVSTIEPLSKRESFQAWWNNGLITYVRLNNTTDIDKLEAQFPDFMDKYFGDDFRESGLRTDIGLQKFRDVYFGDDVQYDRFIHGNLDTVYIFVIIGLFIMIIACINFMNISTAMASLRAKEVGIKKIMGSNRKMLMVQYLMESFLICTLSVILAFMLLEITLPIFNSIYNLSLDINWLDIRIIIYAIGIITSLVLISGIYPAILLSSFSPLKVIGGKGTVGNKSAGWIRKGLVIFQFSCSIILLITTAVIWKQMDFIMNKPLGFDKSNIIMINNNNRDIRSNLDLFIERAEQVPGVEVVTAIVGEPTGFHDTMNFKIEGDSETQRIRTTFADAHYLQCFGIDMVSGRFFRDDNQLDYENAIVLNETSARILGKNNESVLGLKIQNLYVDTLFREVIGVVKDYNFSSLKDEMQPLAIAPTSRPRRIAIKLEAANTKSAISEIEKIYQGIVNLYPFEFNFLDSHIAELYETESTQKRIFIMFSAISIAIGCLGIFGLAAFTANQRSREISIRKVLGASVSNISYMLGNQFVKLVLISNLFAWPLAYYFMNKWLNTFAYRIDLSIGMFVMAMFIALIIAILTVSYQSIKAALVNPASTLRNE